MIRAVPASIDDTQTQLSQTGYVADRALATVVYLALKMGRPLLLEGEAGVGKTEIAKSLATISEHIACTVISGIQPSFNLALVGSPKSVSTSVGRK